MPTRRTFFGGDAAITSFGARLRAFFNLNELLYALRSNFWFTPSLIAIVGFIAALVTVEVDATIKVKAMMDYIPGPKLSVDGARQILSTIAGSMMTMASLVFSMTLVALTMISGQLGPRVMQIFMEDGPTKAVLGIFIATFIFSLIILGAVGVGDDDSFVPQLGVYIAGILSLVSFGMMIHFIHHLSRSLQADVLIARLGDDLLSAVAEVITSERDGSHWLTAREVREDPLEGLSHSGRTRVRARHAGYIQSIDEALACSIATEHEAVIRMMVRPGQYVLENEVFLIAASPGALEKSVVDDLSQVVTVGAIRTRAQQIEFEINALTEIALRALSPGINDPYTAIACIDRLAGALSALATQRGEARVLIDETSGAHRVYLVPQTFHHFLDVSFHPIRASARGETLVLRNMLSSLRQLAPTVRTLAHVEALAAHHAAISEVIAGQVEAAVDRVDLEASLQRTGLAIQERKATLYGSPAG